jgi:hypothetical protein
MANLLPEGSTFFRPTPVDRRSRWDSTPASRKRDRDEEVVPEQSSGSGLSRADREVLPAAIVPAAAPARRAHRRVGPALDALDEVVPAVGFGFDEIPAVDEAIVPVLWDAGLVSALALSVPACTRGGAAPTGSLDVLMAEFSGGSCIGRDARRSKHFLFCYLHLFGEIEDVYAHFKSQPAFVGHVCVLRRGPTTAVLVLRSTMVGISAESLVIGGIAPRFEGRLPSVVRNQARVRSVLINWCGYGEVFYGDCCGQQHVT